MLNRLLAMLYKEFKQVRRDVALLRMLILLPVVQILIFGFAINTDVKHMPTVVFDQTMQQESRELLDVLTATGYYDVKYTAHSMNEVNDLINSGDAVVGIIFPPDLVKNLKHNRTASIQLIADASDTSSASSAINTAQLTIQQKNQQLLNTANKTLSLGTYELRIRPLYNPDLLSVYNIVPGIIGVVLTMTLVMVASSSIVREREEGTLEQLLITPLRPLELIIGKIVPYICIGYLQVTLAIFIGKLVFNVPFKGSILLFYALTTLFIIATLSLGILISTISQTQMQVMQMSIFVMLPSILLSGFVFPRLAMPKIFYYISSILPMTHYIQIARGIFLKGIGIEYLYKPTVSLFIFCIVMFTISILRFRKSISE